MLHRRRNWNDCDGDASRRFSDDELLLATTLLLVKRFIRQFPPNYTSSFKRSWVPHHNNRRTLRAPTGMPYSQKNCAESPER
jgi:hypothetical protein